MVSTIRNLNTKKIENNSVHCHKKQHSLEIRAVKLRFLLIYKIMLKSIATARSECTAKQENKVSYNTEKRLKKEIFIIVTNIVTSKNWFAVSNF